MNQGGWPSIDESYRAPAGRSALSGVGGLRVPFRAFDRATAADQTMRNAMEHVDGTAITGSGGFAFGVSGDRVSITAAGTLGSARITSRAQTTNSATPSRGPSAP